MVKIQHLKLRLRRLPLATILFAFWIVLSFSLPRYFDAHNSFDHSWMTALSQASSGKLFSYGPFSWIFLPDLETVNFLKFFLDFFCVHRFFFLFLSFFIQHLGKERSQSFLELYLSLLLHTLSMMFYFMFHFGFFFLMRKTSSLYVLLSFGRF